MRDKEKQKANCHKHYLKYRERYLLKRREYLLQNKEKILNDKKIYRTKNRKKLTVKRRDYINERRKEIKTTLGSKCCRCGFSDKRALQIHHKIPKTKIRRQDWLKKSSNLSDVELICANCHMIEHFYFFKNDKKIYV